MPLPHARVLISTFGSLFLLVMTCAAQQVPAPRVVDLTSPDGMNLKATYFAASKPGPGILLLHQCNRQRKVWDDLAGRLATSGFNVLTFDFRGFGESGGRQLDKMSPEDAAKIVDEKWPGDVDTAFRYLVSQPSVSPNLIGAGGASCAVNQAVQLARRHPEVKSLVLLSEGTDRDGRQFLRNSKIPLFLAVADDDHDDLGVVELMQWLGSLSSNLSTELVRYSVGGHGIEMFTAHKDLPNMIVDWFEATLTMHADSSVTHGFELVSPETRLLDLTDQPGGGKQAVQMYAEARQRDPKAVLFSEPVINGIGYEHLESGDTTGAVEIFKLNVMAYPNSPNVYDSLSDAYLANGQKDLARETAKKALELLPSDTTDPIAMRDGIKTRCEEKLKQLGDTAQ